MDGDSPEKQPVRLSIYNQTFTLRVSGDPNAMLQAANEVDELMFAISKSGNMDSFRVAILACLHLQDRVHTLEKELDGLKARVSNRSRELAALLDAVSGPDSPR